MSLQDFLLEYAEAAPKAKRYPGLRPAHIRFERDGELDLCPLELPSSGELDYDEAEVAYELNMNVVEFILHAADYEHPKNGIWQEERVWRAVLEKLAERDGIESPVTEGGTA